MRWRGRPTTEVAIRTPEEFAEHFAAMAQAQKLDDVIVLDVRGRASFTDFFVLASGSTRRQVRSAAEAMIVETARDLGARPMSVEGLEAARWVLLDYGDVVVHVFDPDLRDFYDLEGLWADAPRHELPGASSPERVLAGSAGA